MEEGTVEVSAVESPSSEKIKETKPVNSKPSNTTSNSEKIPPSEKVEKTTKRVRDEKHRKKDDKSVEHVLRALNSLNTSEEKLAAMCKKYADLVNDHKAVQIAAKQAEKRVAVLQREKEQIQGEHSKAVLVRSRLENLCRELQKQNKVIKEESSLRIKEEEERRKEVSAKFQTTLNEITTMMQQNSDKNSKLRDDNIDMTAKLKSVCQEFEKREVHVEKLVKQFQLEVQLADAKLAKAKIEMSAEREGLLREKQQLLTEVVEYKTRLEQMQDSELALRNQMTVYNDKYEEFHKALVQSNQVIAGFKAEMDKMSKQIRKLEKETCVWKTKYDETHNTLLKMTDEKVRSDEDLGKANRRVATLHNLCRTLQDQVVQLRNQQKGIVSPNQAAPQTNNIKKKSSEANLTNGEVTTENAQPSNGSTPEVECPNGPASPQCSCDVSAVAHKMSQADLT